MNKEKLKNQKIYLDRYSIKECDLFKSPIEDIKTSNDDLIRALEYSISKISIEKKRIEESQTLINRVRKNL